MLSSRLLLAGRTTLFAGSHEAARRAGMVYSLLATCRMHSIMPYNLLQEELLKKISLEEDIGIKYKYTGPLNLLVPDNHFQRGYFQSIVPYVRDSLQYCLRGFVT